MAMSMQPFEISAVLAQMRSDGKIWSEFLRVPSMSMGIYRLAVGATDAQQPHTEDEAYYIVSGRGKFRCGGEDRAVQAGTILFVERNVEHRFVEVVEDLTIVVFFSPAEHSLKGEQ
jgi:mannose-6-phosphate isomerase-like protein (cupin superfamily)